MYHTQLPVQVWLLVLAFASLQCAALPSPIGDKLRSLSSSLSSLIAVPRWSTTSQPKKRDGNFQMNPNGTEFLWVEQDIYQGSTFFDRFSFYNQSDPTHGTVNFVNASEAWSYGLVYVEDDGTVVMKGDNTTSLPYGQNRNSVRISSNAQYNTGLFILDLNRAPWGCGIWPAFWTIGGGTWPYTGEIDIIEGVHDNEHNQITWHTAPGCNLTPTANFTGTVVQTNGVNNTDCDGTLTGNAGCGITEWSRASYGPYFDSQGGGVFAMKWDETGIAVYSFYRAAIPQDIIQGSPAPSGWGTPDGALAPGGCDPIKFFVNHSIIFDITFCGDWAGNSYATTDCPGTCANQLMNPANFVNASWSINSLKVYKKETLSGSISNAASRRMPLKQRTWSLLSVFASCALVGGLLS